MPIDVQSLTGIVVYFVSSLSGVSIVKFLNYHYCFTSWRTFALLSRSTWVLSLMLHVFLQWRETVRLVYSRRQLSLYFLVAVGLSIVELLNSFSMTMLPGSLYMLLKGSDVGWSMALSYVILHKWYSFVRIVAAGLIMLGIALVFGFDIIYRRRDDHLENDSFQVAAIPVAALLCLLGAFLNALCSVVTEALLKETLQEEQDRQLQQSTQSASSPSKLLLSNSYSMWTSFFSFSLLAIPALIEQTRNSSTDLALSQPSSGGSNSSICPSIDPTRVNQATAEVMNGPVDHSTISYAIAICLALLGASRFLERLCKHFICVHDSAVTFSIVQAARRWFGIYIVGILFHEGFDMGMMVGSLVSGVGFLLHAMSSASSNGASHAYQKVASITSDLADQSTVTSGLELTTKMAKEDLTTS
ncbi:expressed unknown protein [Seminavis robusta]|uniref:Uncharacterized protein n=1 Tax=Seminavis robusta TaxID=568900 RepID=A0A9N8ESV7_9STRA|nr:expressed unknown protein [Seminavis robusta]|eukprot:Sro1495_g277390.1 n/a (415) ;mRNA; f:2341-3585